MATAMSFRAGAQEGMVRSGIFLVSQAIVFYSSLQFLFPKFLIKRKYFLYGLGTVLTIVLAGFVMHMADILFGYDPPFLREMKGLKAHKHMVGHGLKHARHREEVAAFFHRGHIIGHSVASLATLFLSTAIGLSGLRQKKELEESELKRKMLEAESRFLKSQINPHFLFNTMNNIYALAQMKSEQTPEAIHRLSGLLRYVLYDSEKKTVALTQEVDYLKQYVELSLLKDEDKSNVILHLDIRTTELEIAPLILIPFVENAFKHSNVEDKDNGLIRIHLATEGTRLSFEVENSIGSGEQKDATGGVGLENIKRRLELIYLDKFLLEVDHNDDRYLVKLKLDLRES